MDNFKIVTFNRKEYIVPLWVNWLAQGRDGTIKGFQYEPFVEYIDGYKTYWVDHGQQCVVFSVFATPKLEYVGGQS